MQQVIAGFELQLVSLGCAWDGCLHPYDCVTSTTQAHACNITSLKHAENNTWCYYIPHTQSCTHTKKSINHQLSVKLIHGLHGLAIKVGHHNVQYATTSRGSSMHLSSHQSCVRLYLVRGSDSTSWLQIRAKASVDCCEKFHISAEVVYLDCHSFCYSRRQHTVYIRTHSLPSTLYTVTHVS